MQFMDDFYFYHFTESEKKPFRFIEESLNRCKSFRIFFFESTNSLQLIETIKKITIIAWTTTLTPPFVNYNCIKLGSDKKCWNTIPKFTNTVFHCYATGNKINGKLTMSQTYQMFFFKKWKKFCFFVVKLECL